jgi:hypothetical protein
MPGDCAPNRRGQKGRDIMRRIFLGTIAALWLTPALAQGPRLEVKDWQVFVDPQFGTRVDYPADVFSRSGGQSERGIGERFRTADGQAILEVYSLPNDPQFTPEGFLRANLQMPRDELEYHRVTPSFFAISNVRDGMIYYSRCNFSRGPRPLMSCIDLKYPQEQKRAWDDVVTRISRSLRPLVRG